jgi:hypothetical protein
MLKKLVDICKQQFIDGKGVPETMKPLDVAGLVHDRIKTLALKDKLVNLEKEVLNKYHDVFEPIPHIDRLPNNVTAKIRLKNAEKKITSRTYLYPWKY